MLSFLRKYQGIVLTIVGASLILPFTFFGTYRAFEANDKKKDLLIARAVDGSKIFLSDVKLLGQMLGMERGVETLFLKEFLHTGLAERISVAYSDSLADEWKTRLERSKRQRFYVHPVAPTVNARSLWNQFAPGLVEEVGVLQGLNEVSPDFFARWSKIYLLQEKCPAELIRRILAYQQSQMKNVPADPRLASENFALFGYQTPQEWFGRDFFELVAQVILNGAAKAEKKGYRLVDAEVEKELTKRFVSKEGDLLRASGVRQSDAIRLWKKALLFTRYLKEESVAFLGEHSEEVVQNEKAHVELYSLPQELQIRTLDDLLAFKLYQKLACQKSEGDLPTEFLKEKELEKSAPELLMTRYHLRFQEVDLQKIGSRIPMTELWEWQIEKWDELRTHFSALKPVAKEARFQALEKLDAKLRSSVDEWSREQIIMSHPEWIEHEYNMAPLQDREIALSGDNQRAEGLSVSQIASFRAALDSWKGASLEFRDRKKVFRIDSVERVPEKEVVSLAVAKAKGILKTDRYLQQLYEQVRVRASAEFQDEAGKWKPLASVKEAVVQRAFKEKPYRLFESEMQKKLAELSKEASSLDFGLWKLNKSEKTLDQENLSLSPGQWSSLFVPENGDLSFYVVKNLVQEKSENSLQSKGAMGKVLEQLLCDISAKSALVFPVRDVGGDEPTN